MTGKETLDDYKDFGKIKGESITSNHTCVPSDYHYEWKKAQNFEEELTKYKKAFEILKKTLNMELVYVDEGCEPTWFLDANGGREIEKEEYELLEELMKDENS